MLNKKQNILREALTVVLLLASVAVAEYWFFSCWRAGLEGAMLYGGDGIYWVGQIQRSFGELTGSLGWPFYQAPSPYEPNYDLVYDIFVAFVGLFTKDTGTVFNLYILASLCQCAGRVYGIPHGGHAPVAVLRLRHDLRPVCLCAAAPGRPHDAGRRGVCAVLGLALPLVRGGPQF